MGVSVDRVWLTDVEITLIRKSLIEYGNRRKGDYLRSRYGDLNKLRQIRAACSLDRKLKEVEEGYTNED